MKTWQEKLHNGKSAQVKPLEKAFAGMPVGSLMYISTPSIIEGFIRQIPAGKSLQVAQLRDQLAKQNQAEFTCPLSTGIFLRIVAEAAYEALQAGTREDAITPFWRVIEPSSKLALKLTFDPAFIELKRRQEQI